MRVSYSDGYYAPIPNEHIFPMHKFDGLYQYVIDKGIIDQSCIVEPSMVDIAYLMMVHTQRYINGILKGNLEYNEARRLGLPWSLGLARRSRLAVQGTINAALMALQDGISGNLAGGTHHSFPDRGEGFCVFNDVAVAIRVLKKSMWINKAMVIDCDVHQGNGTASFFENNSDVYTFSVHGEKNYPFKKPPSSYDLGLPDKTEDKSYIQALGDSLDHIFNEFQPDIVFYLGGIDILKSDHFGRLNVSIDGLINRDRMVIERVHKKNIPLVLLLSGGYAPTLKETVEAHSHMFKIAAEFV
ncbi:MAG TPA: histone deacetylase [Balneolales bacterium]|nr:histone deacetylase [Balneolales bacterium]